jgi:hypothetical protein
VSGDHTYAAGTDTVTVTLRDDAPGTASATATTTATVNPQLAGQLVLAAATEHVALADNTPVATFTDANTSDTASSFTATIDWGDATPVTIGTVVAGSNGAFTVTGGHTYADEGSPNPSVRITRTADNAQITPSGTVTVAEHDALTPQGTAIAATVGQSFSGTVGSFTDTDTSNVASDFNATIDWGDGTTTAGTVSGGSGTFTVSGDHTYAAAGTDTVMVTLSDDGSGTAAATAKSTAKVAGLARQVSLTAATEGLAIPVRTTVATFTDTNTSDTASSFAATIKWHDGPPTSGTVTGSNGRFTVAGGHTYADEGSFPLGVTITNRANNTSVPLSSGTVAVAEGDVLTAHPLSFTANPGQAFSGKVATFTDRNRSNVASDFSAMISWGDGTTTAGTVSGGSGTFTVSGNHTYTAAGTDTVMVTLSDDGSGTAAATAKSTAKLRGSGGHTHSLTLLNGDNSSTNQSAAALLASGDNGAAFHGIDLSGQSLGGNSTLADLSAGVVAAGSSTANHDPHGQTLALLGQYMASSFVVPSDGHTGTPINDPQDQQHHLSLPHPG